MYDDKGSIFFSVVAAVEKQRLIYPFSFPISKTFGDESLIHPWDFVLTTGFTILRIFLD